MNTEFSAEDWEQLSSRLRSEYGWLTDDDLDLIEGNWQELVARLQEEYNYSLAEAEKEVERFLLEQQL